MEETPNYHAYLLRLWKAGADAEGPWRASLESPVTGERRGFATLPALFAYLEAKVARERELRAAGGGSPAPDRGGGET
jgi:hypothetical protein